MVVIFLLAATVTHQKLKALSAFKSLDRVSSQSKPYGTLEGQVFRILQMKISKTFIFECNTMISHFWS